MKDSNSKQSNSTGSIFLNHVSVACEEEQVNFDKLVSKFKTKESPKAKG